MAESALSCFGFLSSDSYIGFKDLYDGRKIDSVLLMLFVLCIKLLIVFNWVLSFGLSFFIAIVCFLGKRFDKKVPLNRVFDFGKEKLVVGVFDGSTVSKANVLDDLDVHSSAAG